MTVDRCLFCSPSSNHSSISSPRQHQIHHKIERRCWISTLQMLKSQIQFSKKKFQGEIFEGLRYCTVLQSQIQGTVLQRKLKSYRVSTIEWHPEIQVSKKDSWGLHYCELVSNSRDSGVFWGFAWLAIRYSTDNDVITKNWSQYLRKQLCFDLLMCRHYNHEALFLDNGKSGASNTGTIRFFLTM